jgi:hypothetical protein
MTRADQPVPCQVGLRCPNPETCDHTFQHPDQSINRLHPDDWFAEPDRADFPKTGAGELQHANAVAEAARTTARAQWACKLDCPQTQRLECLAQGLIAGPTLTYGVFGGYTPAQRQAIVKEREKRQKAAGGTTD